MPWNKEILSLLRECRFCLQRFEEDEDMDELQTACQILADIVGETGSEIVVEEAPPSGSN